MKRLFLAIGLAAFLMTSCCDGQNEKENKGKCEGNCKEKKEQCDHHECDHHGPQCQMPAEDRAEIEGIIAAFKGWENLDEAQKTAAIATAKARVEKCEAMRAEMEAKRAEMEANRPEKPEGCPEGRPEGPKCNGEHQGCNHEGAPKCEGKPEGRPEAPKCEGNHEGCNHEGAPKCEGKPEGRPEAPKCEGEHQCQGMTMTKEECDAKWAAFDTLTLDEQKAVLCCKLHHCPGFMMVMHDMMAPKCDSLAPKCEGQHEGCCGK